MSPTHVPVVPAGHEQLYAECHNAPAVDLLTFHLDLAEQVPVFMRARDRRLREPWPAWTAIGAAS